MEDALIVHWLHFSSQLRSVTIWSGARGGMGHLGKWENQEIGWQKTYEQVSTDAEGPLIDAGAFV